MNGEPGSTLPASAGAPLHYRTSRLTWLYVSALTTVALLSITGQLLVQRSLQRQRGDSTVVNIAGRQRMLSQRLTKAVLAWNHATSDADRQTRAQEISDTLELWKRSHLGLQQGDPEVHLTPNTSPMVAAQFAKLDPVFQEMVSATTRFTTVQETERQQLLASLLQAEPKFLTAMDAVVFQLDREAQARVARLQRIEWALLSLTLLVLVVEGLLVFRPAVLSIGQAADALVESQEQLRIAKEAAESASAQKSRFLATLSHELRNPLHAILGNLELVLETPLTEPQREYLSTVDSSARSLLSLVSDLLDLACIQAGKLRVSSAPCDLGELAKRCIAMMEPLAERKGLRLSLQLLDEPVHLNVDPLRVQQVLLNLLGNAVKFTSTGWITLRIGCLPPSQQVRLEVIDTGPGIPRDLQQTIFAAFAQGDASTRREHAGVGLGLAISAGLVELMSGRIGVESEVGQGSRFWVELPIGEIAAPPVTEAVQPHVQQQLTGRRVLVAEDDAVNRRLLSDFLHLLGHDALLSADGLDALAHYKQHPCDFVLLDWHMPQLDGLELAREIRAWELAQHLSRVPLIAVSAAGAIADEMQARAAGIDLILVKPLGLDQLRQAISSFTVVDQSKNELPATPHTFPFAGTLARMQGKRDLFCDVATIFLEQLPEELKRLEELAAKQEYGELARASHLLRGQAVNFDAADLVRVTGELEENAAARDAAKCEAAIQAINLAAEALQTSLRLAVHQLQEPNPAAALSRA